MIFKILNQIEYFNKCFSEILELFLTWLVKEILQLGPFNKEKFLRFLKKIKNEKTSIRTRMNCVYDAYLEIAC